MKESTSIIIELWPPSPKNGMVFDSDNNRKGIRALHKPSGISVICFDHAQEHKNRAEAVNKLESILKHRRFGY